MCKYHHIAIIVDMRIFCSAFVASVSESGHGLLVIPLCFSPNGTHGMMTPNELILVGVEATSIESAILLKMFSMVHNPHSVCTLSGTSGLLNFPPQIVIICCTLPLRSYPAVKQRVYWSELDMKLEAGLVGTVLCWISPWEMLPTQVSFMWSSNTSMSGCHQIEIRRSMVGRDNKRGGSRWDIQ